MKKIALLLVFVLALGMFTSCGNSGNETSAEAESTETSGETSDFSDGFDDEGYIQNVKALSLIDFPDFAKDFVFQKADLLPSDEVIEEAIEASRSKVAEKVTDRKVSDGDKVNIDYVGTVDGVEFEGGSAKGADVTAGSKEFIDDFLTQIIGHMPGETVKVEVTFPENYGKDELNGKDAVFMTTINYISVNPEITDEFLKEHQEEYETNTGIRPANSLKAVKEYLTDYYYKKNFTAKFSEACSKKYKDIEIPKEIHDIEYRMEDQQMQTYYGGTLQQMIDNGYLTEEKVEEQVRIGAIQLLISQAVAEHEDWHIQESDYKAVTGTEDNAEWVAYYGKGYLSNLCMYQKAAEYIRENVTIEE